MKFLIILTVLFLSSCSNLKQWYHEVSEPDSIYKEVPLNHQALVGQRLIPRPGYTGLTNQVCLEFYGPDCIKKSIREYKLEDPKVRDAFNEFKFACHIGGKRYRICKDQPGFCRTESHSVCERWGKKLFSRRKVCRRWGTEEKKMYKPISDYQFLLDGATECKAGY